MNVDDSYRYDQYYRVLELSTDPEVGPEVSELLQAQVRMDMIKTLVMTNNREEGLAKVKKYLKENPR